MMSLEMVLELLASAGDDLMVEVYGDEVSVVVEDFVGFDEDWSEVERDLDDADLVDSVEEQLSAECVSEDGDFYHYYHFDGFSVCWGYASFEV